MLFSYCKIKYLFILFLILFFSNNFLFSQGQRQNILSYGPSVQSLSLGEAVVGFPIDAPGISFYNPALLNKIETLNVGASYWQLYDGAMYNHIGLNTQNFELSYIQFSRNNILKFSSIDDDGVNISNTQSVVNIAYGFNFLGIACGAGLKYLSYSIDNYNDWGLTTDFGFFKTLKKFDTFDTNINSGFVFKNIIQKEIKLLEEKEKIPFYFDYGFSITSSLNRNYNPETDILKKDSISFLTDFEYRDYLFSSKLGLEYIYRDAFAIRCGYKDGLNVGFGFFINNIELEYAYSIRDFTDFHRIGVIYRFRDNNKAIPVKYKYIEDFYTIYNKALRKSKKYIDEAKNLIEKEKFQESKLLLFKAFILNPKDKNIGKLLKVCGINNLDESLKLEKIKYIEQGIGYLDEKKLEIAYLNFSKAYALEKDEKVFNFLLKIRKQYKKDTVVNIQDKLYADTLYYKAALSKIDSNKQEFQNDYQSLLTFNPVYENIWILEQSLEK